VEEEGKDALEVGEEAQKEDEEVAEEKGRRTLMPLARPCFVGIDLAGSEKRVTGFCLMDSRLACSTIALHSDSEIIGETLKARPSVVSIDAPLCLPKGRKSLEDRNAPHLRVCDRQLLRLHIRFFPITLGPMRMLTARGMKLKGVLEQEGMTVIESFPGSAQDLLGMPRKQMGLPRLRRALSDFGVTGRDLRRKDITHDELDAITCAIVGKLYAEGRYTALGSEEEGFLIVPRLSRSGGLNLR
jgi:predicted nuclease with RNAse H fold